MLWKKSHSHSVGGLSASALLMALTSSNKSQSETKYTVGKGFHMLGISSGEVYLQHKGSFFPALR